MSARRFVVGSVSGYTFEQHGAGSSRPSMAWYVYDTAYAWRAVAEYRSRYGRIWAKHQAKKRARELNAWDAAL